MVQIRPLQLIMKYLLITLLFLTTSSAYAEINVDIKDKVILSCPNIPVNKNVKIQWIIRPVKDKDKIARNYTLKLAEGQYQIWAVVYVYDIKIAWFYKEVKIESNPKPAENKPKSTKSKTKRPKKSFQGARGYKHRRK